MSDSASFVRLVVGFFLSATGIHVIVACPIELDPPSVVVKYGDPVFVNCSTTTTMFDGMGWEASSGHTPLMDVKHVIWKVDSLKQWTVSPKCFLNEQYPDQDDITQCRKNLPIVVYQFPENVTIRSSAGPTGLMNEGTQYNLECVVHDVAPVRYLTLRWYKGNETIHTNTFDSDIKEPVDQTSVLSFVPSRHDNGAQLRCEAEMQLGPNGPHYLFSEYYPVTVYFGPDIQCSTIEILEGETLEGRCQVTGNPSPTISWLRAGQPIDPMVPLRRENAGLYTIKAEGYVSVHKLLRVFVLYGPELNCPSNYTAVEYAPHNFTCTVQGFPRPETTWYKDNDEVEPPANLTRSDAGQYMIIASNNRSSVSRIVDITVLYPPTEIVELEDAEVEVGSPLWLKCSSMGNPRPKYVWSYYRTAKVEEESEDGVSRLYIHKVKAENEGSYTCYAWNERGNVSKKVTVTVTGAHFECPIEISPHRMVVPFQGQGRDATCRPSPTGSRNVKDMYWQISHGRVDNTTLFLGTNEDWDPKPVCTATFEGIATCSKSLDFTMYKTPDSVSIRSVDIMDWVAEGTRCQLQCDITNVAPVENLTVRWYQGNETMKIDGTLQVTGCLPQYTNCDMKVRTPVHVSSTISITADKRHNGEEFRCEACLDLGPEGPQLPPTVTSTTFNITVYYKPIINATKLPERIPLFRGYPEVLVCEAEGHPPPRIQWLHRSKVSHVSGGTLTVLEEGHYTCNATNEAGFSLHEVEVILNEDYLPLIAGFVAVTVVVISIIFVFIYSIYYKNTKMRRYSLKNPKLSTQNGNVAHNGLDLQYPMNKLS